MRLRVSRVCPDLRIRRAARAQWCLTKHSHFSLGVRLRTKSAIGDLPAPGVTWAAVAFKAATASPRRPPSSSRRTPKRERRFRAGVAFVGATPRALLIFISTACLSLLVTKTTLVGRRGRSRAAKGRSLNRWSDRGKFLRVSTSFANDFWTVCMAHCCSLHSPSPPLPLQGRTAVLSASGLCCPRHFFKASY